MAWCAPVAWAKRITLIIKAPTKRLLKMELFLFKGLSVILTGCLAHSAIMADVLRQIGGGGKKSAN
jgi:hypothetical protein